MWFNISVTCNNLQLLAIMRLFFTSLEWSLIIILFLFFLLLLFFVPTLAFNNLQLEYKHKQRLFMKRASWTQT